jgi:hypothetical protein
MTWTVHGHPEIFYRVVGGRTEIYEVLVGDGCMVLEFLGYL